MDINAKKEAWYRKSNLRWVVTALVGVSVAIFNFFGPDIHSEVENAPTLLSDGISTVLITIIAGSFLLPINASNKFNLGNIVVMIGTAIWGLRTVQLAIGVMPTATSGQNIPGLVAVGAFFLGFIFLIFKVKKIFVTNSPQKTSDSASPSK